MWHFQRINLLDSLINKKYISFVGSGGKSTFIENIAAEAIKRDKSVAITTTTKIYAKEPYILLDKDIFEKTWKEQFMRVGKTIEEGKLTGITAHDIEELGKMYDMVLIEADGARGKPLKFPADYEPVIPPCSEKIFVLCGLDGLSGRVDETVFRWELFSQATGIEGNASITPEAFLRFFSDDILLKHVDREKCTIVLNKYDVSKMRNTIKEIAKSVVHRTGGISVIVSSMMFELFYLVTEE